MSLNGIVILGVVAASALLVAALMRMLQLDAVPILARASVRRAAATILSRRPRYIRRGQLLSRHQARGALGMFLFVSAVALLPDPNLGIAPVANPAAARDYLDPLWQVLATVLGVSIVLIAFVLQAFIGGGERRHGGTLREFAAETGLLVSVDFAAASLLLDGIVLQGNIGDAPAGWPGAMAILFSGVAVIGLLTVVPRLVLRIIDPEHLRSVRAIRAREAVDESLREQVVGQVGDTMLWEERERWRVTRGLAPTTQWTVKASGDGYLYDMRLGPLRRIARTLPVGSLEVLVTVGDEVSAEDPLLCLPSVISRSTRWRARRAFVIRRRSSMRSSQALTRQLDLLARQGVAAIRGRQESEWREINDVYREILTRFPSTAQEFGLAFEGAVSRPGLLGRGPVSRLLDDLRDAVKEVLRADDAEIAGSIAHTGILVAGEVAHLNAAAMIRDTLSWYVATYVLARNDLDRTGSTETNEALLRLSVTCMFDGLDRVSGYGPRAGYREFDDAKAISNMRTGLAGAQELLRVLVGRGDVSRVAEVMKRLGDLTEPWRELDPTPDDLARLFCEIDGLILVVAMWAAHLALRDEGAQTGGEAHTLALLLAWLTEGNQVLRAYEAVTGDRDRSFGDDWSFWFYDQKVGGVQTLSGGLQLERAVVLALTAIAAQQGTLPLDPVDILDYRLDGLIQAVDRVDEESRWDFLVVGDQGAEPGVSETATRPLERALGIVRDSLRAAAKDRADSEAERVRAASLDGGQVERFKRAAVRATSEGRLVHDLLEHLDATASVPAPSSPTILSRNWLNKRFFVGDRSYVGQDMTAKQLAQSAGVAERQALVAAVNPPPAAGPSDDVADAVRVAIGAMREEGLVPSLILIPLGFELAGALGLQPYRKVALQSDGIPAAHARDFNGEIDRVPVLHDPRLDTSALFIVDLRAAVFLEEWPSDSNSGVEVVVQAFDPTSADDFIDANPAVVPSTADRSEVALLIQQQVLIEVRRCWSIKQRDPSATRRIEVPESLRRSPRQDGPAG